MASSLERAARWCVEELEEEALSIAWRAMAAAAFFRLWASPDKTAGDRVVSVAACFLAMFFASGALVHLRRWFLAGIDAMFPEIEDDDEGDGGDEVDAETARPLATGQKDEARLS